MFQSQLLKVQADIKFIKTRKSESLVPTFANVKLAVKNWKHKLKSKIARLIVDTQLQSKHNQKKIKKGLVSVYITLKLSLSVIFCNCLNHQINVAFKNKGTEATCVEIATAMKKCSRLKNMPNFNVLWNV